MFSTRICENLGYKRNIKERLDALVEIHSVKTKLLGTRTCLSLPKINQDSNSKKSSNKTLASNNTLSISSIIDEYDALKLSFFAEVNLFKVFSGYLFFLETEKYCFFSHKTVERPYLDLHFKFDHFFSQ